MEALRCARLYQHYRQRHSSSCLLALVERDEVPPGVVPPWVPLPLGWVGAFKSDLQMSVSQKESD